MFKDEASQQWPRFIIGKVESCHVSPPLPGARRVTFLARILGELPADVNKYKSIYFHFAPISHFQTFNTKRT